MNYLFTDSDFPEDGAKPPWFHKKATKAARRGAWLIARDKRKESSGGDGATGLSSALSPKAIAATSAAPDTAVTKAPGVSPLLSDLADTIRVTADARPREGEPKDDFIPPHDGDGGAFGGNGGAQDEPFEETRSHHKKQAGSSGCDGTLPLFPPPKAALPYPTKALGVVLSCAAEAIAEFANIDEVMAAHSVLAASSLATCAHADVRLPYGRARLPSF